MEPAPVRPPEAQQAEGAALEPDPYGLEAADPAAFSGVGLVRRIEEALATKPKGTVPLRERIDGLRRLVVRQLTDRDVDIAAFQKQAQETAGRPLRPEELAYELNRLTNGSDYAAQVRVQEELIPAIRAVGEDRGKLSAVLKLREMAATTNGTAYAPKALEALAAEIGPARWRRLEEAAGQVETFRAGLARMRSAAGLPEQKSAKVNTALAPRAISDPLADLVAEAFKTERDARRNAVFQAMGHLADLLPGGQVARTAVEQAGDRSASYRIVGGWIDGQRAHLRMPKEMADAIDAETKGIGIPGLAAAMSVFKAALTSRNPTFLLANSVLDAFNYTGRTLSREGGNPLRIPGIVGDLIRAYFDTFKGLASGEYRGEATARYLRQGGGSFGFYQPEGGTAQKALSDYLRTNALEVKSVDDVKRIITDLALFKPVESVGERVELAPRIAAMRRAEKAGADAVRATLAGRSVTLDFAAGGHLSRALNSWIPFFNAATQGATVPARAFAENPRGFAAATATMLVVPTAMAEAWNRADEQRSRDYDDIPDEVRNQGLILMLPGEAPVDGRGERRPQFILLKTREWTPAMLAVREATARALGAEPGKWQELAAAAGLALSPVQGSSAADALSNLMPPAAGTVFQVAQDRNIYFDSPIATKSADANASPLSRGIAGALEAIGLDAKPSQVEFAIRDYLGGIGQAYSEGSKIAFGEHKRTDLPQDVPGAGGFIRRFVRGDIGGTLERAKEARLSPEADALLEEAGLGDYTPAPVPYKIGDTALTREQQARYQLLTNAGVDAAIRQLASAPGWERATVADRERALKAAATAARKEAEAEVAVALGISQKRAPAPTPSTDLLAPRRTPAPEGRSVAPGAPSRPTPTRTDVDPERSAGARRAAETRRRNATATAEARR